MPISQDTLEIIPQLAAAAPVAPTDDNPCIPPAANIDNNLIPDDIASTSADNSDPTSLAATLGNMTMNDDTDANTGAVHSGESAEDTFTTL
jgi:hypothetical protein